MKKIIKEIKRTIEDMDKPLLILMLIFIIFGTLNIVTASSREAVVRYNASLYHYFNQQIKMLFISLIGSTIIISIPTKEYRKYAPLAFIGIFIVCTYLLLFGVTHKGAQNWISILGFTFQPSEFAKPIIIVCLALLFEQFYNRLRNKKINHYSIIGSILFVGLAIPAIVFLQKDFGTMLIMVAIFGTMYLLSPILRLEKVKSIGFVFITVILALFVMWQVKGYILSSAQLDRFNFINPCSHYETGGYQICNGFIAINDGGLLGLGIGKSKQKYSYIPEPHTDSVFSIISEEYGLIKSTLVFIGYIFILKRILDLGCRANTLRGRYMCIGFATYIFMHILVNLGGLFALMPLTGVPLPFLSYGGSFTISLICSLAVVQRIHIETVNQKIKI